MRIVGWCRLRSASLVVPLGLGSDVAEVEGRDVITLSPCALRPSVRKMTGGRRAFDESASFTAARNDEFIG